MNPTTGGVVADHYTAGAVDDEIVIDSDIGSARDENTRRAVAVGALSDPRSACTRHIAVLRCRCPEVAPADDFVVPRDRIVPATAFIRPERDRRAGHVFEHVVFNQRAIAARVERVGVRNLPYSMNP